MRKHVDYSKAPKNRVKKRSSDTWQDGNQQMSKEVVDTSVKVIPERNMYSDATPDIPEQEDEIGAELFKDDILEDQFQKENEKRVKKERAAKEAQEGIQRSRTKRRKTQLNNYAKEAKAVGIPTVIKDDVVGEGMRADLEAAADDKQVVNNRLNDDNPDDDYMLTRFKRRYGG